jgi:hypothetical protein
MVSFLGASRLAQGGKLPPYNLPIALNLMMVQPKADPPQAETGADDPAPNERKTEVRSLKNTDQAS